MIRSILNTVLAAAFVAVPFVAVACCSDIENPDDQLTIEVQEPTEAVDENGEAAGENRCDADVIARADDGEEVVLEEQVRDNSDGSDRCVYVGTVSPHKLYTVEVQREGKVGFAVNAESNPGCSVATDPADTDNVLSLLAPAERPQLRSARPTSPIANENVDLSR